MVDQDEIVTAKRSDKEFPAIRRAIKCIEDFKDTKSNQDEINRKIQDLFEEGFEVSDPTGTKKINSQMLLQAFWRLASRMKPLDFQIHGTGRPEYVEHVVKEGISTVLDKGGYISGFRDKEGVAQKLLMYGDAFVHVGTDEESAYPIQFNVLSNSNLYVDSYCTAIRGSKGRSARKAVAVFSMPWEQVKKEYPKMKKYGGPGQIPRETMNLKELERSKQPIYKQKDLTEIAHFYDLDKKTYTVFGGSACTLIDHQTNYPFVIDDEPYIPILHFMGIPSFEGFYNIGVGALLYRLAIVTRRLMNMGIGHVEENVWPLTLFNIPEEETANFFQKLTMGYEARAVGKRGFIVNEYNPTTGPAPVSAESLSVGTIFNEWQALFDRLDRELKRLGIQVDDIDRGSDITATQIFSEAESADAFIKQIAEWSASTSQFAVDLSIDFMKQFVPANDRTPINLSTMVEMDGEQVKIDSVSLGSVAEELRTNHYFTIINARSGTVPSNLLETAQVERVMAMTQPGTPAYTKLLVEWSALHGRDLKAEDFGGNMQQGGSPPSDTPPKDAGAQTDRLMKPTPQSQPVPAL